MREIWDLIVYNFIGCLIVFARVTGIFSFNPIFGRANVPMRVRAAMSIVLTVVMLMSFGGVIGYIPQNIPSLVAVILKEAALGLIFGFVINLVLTVLIYAGETIDNQIGLGMAKVMDPGTNINMPVFANLYNNVFILYFFLTGGHLSYIRLFSQSYEMLPIGFEMSLSFVDASYRIAMFLGTVMTLAIKMAMPVIAAELVTELCVGVMMKAVPTIQVFVINIQLKLLLGLFIIMAISGPMSDYLDKLLGIMWENLFGTLSLLA